MIGQGLKPNLRSRIQIRESDIAVTQAFATKFAQSRVIYQAIMLLSEYRWKCTYCAPACQFLKLVPNRYVSYLKGFLHPRCIFLMCIFEIFICMCNDQKEMSNLPWKDTQQKIILKKQLSVVESHTTVKNIRDNSGPYN